MRLIDADALEKEIEEITKEPDYQHEGENWSVGVIIAQSAVQDAPTIEAVPVVHGEVVTKVGDWGVMHQECSVCGEGLEWKSYPNFCPNCGADLRKKV